MSAKKKSKKATTDKAQAAAAKIDSGTRLDAAQESAADFARIFTKWKMLTYASVIFLPPYALWRIWSRQSEFRRAEKAVWTMIVLVYMANFLALVFPA